MAITKDDLEAALDQAVAHNFVQLFNVLMASSDPEAIKRFQKGVAHLVETEAAVLEVIETVEE